MLEREVAFTRVGKGGIRQVPVTGLVAAAFDHRDSRSGDPDLHTHLVVSNKVQTLSAEGGKWLTLDGRMLFKAKVMASEHYNTRLEAEPTDRLGVRFVERPGPQGRRPVRELDGLDPRLLEVNQAPAASATPPNVLARSPKSRQDPPPARSTAQGQGKVDETGELYGFWEVDCA